MVNSRMTDVFAALSDPTRRRIVEMLVEHGAHRVADISDSFNMSRQAVTKHLDILSQAGVVVSQRRGRERFSDLADNAFDDIHDWLSRYDRFWERKLDELKQLVEGGETP